MNLDKETHWMCKTLTCTIYNPLMAKPPNKNTTSHSIPPLSIFEESHEWTIIWSDKKEEGKLNGKCFLVFVSAWSVLYNWLHMLKSDYIINTCLDWLSTSSMMPRYSWNGVSINYVTKNLLKLFQKFKILVSIFTCIFLIFFLS